MRAAFTRFQSNTFLGLLVLSAFVALPIASYTAVYVAIAAGVLGYFIPASTVSGEFGNRIYLPLWIGFGLITISAISPGKAPEDLLVLAYLLPLALTPFVAGQAKRIDFQLLLLIVGISCLIGVTIAAVASFFETIVFDSGRAGSGNNPIHFASITVMIGCLSPVGIFALKSNWRVLLLAGPLLAFFVALLSGSKGPLLTCLVLTALILSTVIIRLPELRIAVMGILVAGIAVMGALALSGTFAIQRALQLFELLPFMSDGQSSQANSISERLLYYRSAFSAFMDSPLTGIGFTKMVFAPGIYMSEFVEGTGGTAHLHSDIADFMATGGLLGIACYLLFLSMPVVACAFISDKAVRPAACLFAATLVLGMLTLGLTNAVFGVLPQTTLFAVMTGLLAAGVNPRKSA